MCSKNILQNKCEIKAFSEKQQQNFSLADMTCKFLRGKAKNINKT